MTSEGPTDSKETAALSAGQTALWVGLTVVGTLLGWYASAILSFAGHTYGFNNRFTEVAIQHHWGYLVWNNLVVLKGYLLVALGYLLMIYPLVRLWARWQRFGRRGVVWRTLLFAAALYGFFILRLTLAKPYFGDYGYLMGWYTALGKWFGVGVQQSVGGVLTHVLPTLMALTAAVWYIVQLRRSVAVAARPLFFSLVGIVAVIGILSATGLALTRLDDAPLVEMTQRKPKNILILASDSLRADHLSCNGYERPTSPSIDALAEKGINFGLCMTPIASTLESMTTIFSSQYPHTHGIHHMFPNREMVDRVRVESPTLPGAVKRLGYDTAVIGDWCACGFNELPMGFDEVVVADFDNFRVYMSEVVYLHHQILPLFFDNRLGHAVFPKLRSFANYMTPDVVTDQIIERLEKRADDEQPFLMLAFYSATHLPYKTPMPYSKLWTDPDYDGPHKHELALNVDEFIGSTDINEKWRKFPREEVEQVVGLYDGCVRMFDDCVGRIVSRMDELGLMEDTIILVTGDHGDDLFEPGVTFGHGLTFNGGDQSNHVPAVFYVPEAAAPGRRFEGVVRTIDFAPTLLELVGLPPEPGFEGTSLAPIIQSTEETLDLAFYGESSYLFFKRHIEGEEPLHIPAMDETTFIDPTFDFHFVLKPEFAQAVLDTKEYVVRTERFKYVRTPGVHRPIVRLFDLAVDPHCQVNVEARFPDVRDRMAAALDRWQTKGDQSTVAEIFGILPERDIQPVSR